MFFDDIFASRFRLYHIPIHREQKQVSIMGFFDKLKKGLKKTKNLLKTDVRDLFKSEGRLVDDEFLDELRPILFRTDMGYDPVETLIAEVASQMRGRVVHKEEIFESWKNKLKELMKQDSSPINYAKSGPTIIMVCGVNGAGKTTSIAKLAHLLKAEGKSVVLGAGDTFRAAAVQQLRIWSERLGVHFVSGDDGAHPASVAYRAVEECIKIGADVCIVDTAGRLQTQKKPDARALTGVGRVICR